MSALPRKFYSPQEYLILERKAKHKSEYWDGDIYAMAGASREHNLIASNVTTELTAQLRASPCEVYPSDMRVRIPRKARYVYPDVSVACDEPRFEDDVFDTLLNPTVIIEILSETTEGFDRGKKFDSYRTIDSLQAYVLIAQDRYQVMVSARQANRQWLFTDIVDPDGVAVLSSIGCQLKLVDIYHKVRIIEAGQPGE